MVKSGDRLKALFDKKSVKRPSRATGKTASQQAVELYKLTMRLPADLVRALKHEAVDRKTTLTAIVEEKLKK